MSKDPAFLFYPGDWLGGTVLFSRSHKGAYMDLLMAQFNSGHMAIQDIKDLLGMDFENMWEQKLKSKFKQDENGLFYNKKLEDEILKRRNFTDSRRKNLKSEGSHKDTHMDNHMENENKDVINKEYGEIICIYDFETLKKELFKEIWLESIAMASYSKGISMTDLKKQLLIFCETIRDTKDFGKPIKNYQNHFVHWFQKQPGKQPEKVKAVVFNMK
jgi:uncharacterized protein YdaU (DUF1376 family)